MLRADLLDILFEHRNKAYGAYALRRSYDKRLWTALAAAMMMAGLAIVLLQLKPGKEPLVLRQDKEGIVIRQYVVPVKKIEKPVKPKEPVRAKALVKKTAQVKYTSTIDIRKDEDVKAPVASVDDLAGKKTGDENIAGKPDEAVVNLPEPPGDGVSLKSPEAAVPVFVPLEREPAFPGGADALHRFLSRYLQTPGELDEGERVMVKVRFKVAADGYVTNFEIAESGGKEFDEEVLRVVKKMPRWEPAFQNGIHVPVTFMIPVTFMGTE